MLFLLAVGSAEACHEALEEGQTTGHQNWDDAITEFDPKKLSHIHHALHSDLPSEPALRTKALESLLTEKKLLDAAAIDAWIEMYRDEIGPKRGAAVVARAWIDPAFKERLLADGTSAIAELGFAGHATGHLQAVENTPTVHNLVVCTLCSCYPFSLLGMSPAWYKSNKYRARAVRDPRGVLKEFGVELGAETQMRVWDSTSERRYLVVPQRPVGLEGWEEGARAELVTRNSMIGTQRDLYPSGMTS
jgi:nitrile hydratase